jgi:hypothetical protein
MPREKSKGQIPEDESTDAENRGGTARMSEEVSVMEIDAKGLSYSVLFDCQPEIGGTV